MNPEMIAFIKVFANALLAAAGGQGVEQIETKAEAPAKKSRAAKPAVDEDDGEEEDVPAKKAPAKKGRKAKDPLAELKEEAKAAYKAVLKEEGKAVAAEVLEEFDLESVAGVDEMDDEEVLQEFIDACTADGEEEEGEEGEEGGEVEDVDPDTLKAILQDFRKALSKEALSELLEEFGKKTPAAALKLDQEEMNELYDLAVEIMEENA